MALLPAFGPDGLLPPGEYTLTLDQLRESVLVLGPDEPRRHPAWDAAWRLELVERLGEMARYLWQAGIEDIFIDGSFVEDKDHPNDIDGYFVCSEQRIRTRSLQNELNRIDPLKCWTWDQRERRPYRGYPKRQLPMWHAYRVELYPHWPGLIAGTDEHGHELEFPAFFRKCRRTGRPKGVIRFTPKHSVEQREEQPR